MITLRRYINGRPKNRASQFLHPDQRFKGPWRFVRQPPNLLCRWERRVTDSRGVSNIMRIFVYDDGSLAHPFLSRKW